MRRIFFVSFEATAKLYVATHTQCNKRVAELRNFELLKKKKWHSLGETHTRTHTHAHTQTHGRNRARVSDRYTHIHTEQRIARTHNRISNQQQQQY